MLACMINHKTNSMVTRTISKSQIIYSHDLGDGMTLRFINGETHVDTETNKIRRQIKGAFFKYTCYIESENIAVWAGGTSLDPEKAVEYINKARGQGLLDEFYSKLVRD